MRLIFITCFLFWLKCFESVFIQIKFEPSELNADGSGLLDRNLSIKSYRKLISYELHNIGFIIVFWYTLRLNSERKEHDAVIFILARLKIATFEINHSNFFLKNSLYFMGIKYRKYPNVFRAFIRYVRPVNLLAFNQ